MARRGRGKDDRFPKIHPVGPTHGARKLTGVSRFGSTMRPRRMAAWLDRYAKQADRLAQHEQVAKPAPPPRPVRRRQAPRALTEPLFARLVRWLREVWSRG